MVNNMRSVLYGVIGLVVVAGSAVAGFFGQEDVEITVYNIGDEIEEFKLSGLDGNDYSLSDIIGESGSVLIFTCNTCPYSKLYEERILQISNVYGDVGYPMTIINPSDPELKPGDHKDELIKWTEETGFDSVYLIDDIELHRRFGAKKTPEVFLLDKSRVLRYRGAIDNSAQGSESVTDKYLENAIRALENNENPDPAETRPVGCIIKSD